jgi:hypothetical protein
MADELNWVSENSLATAVVPAPLLLLRLLLHLPLLLLLPPKVLVIWLLLLLLLGPLLLLHAPVPLINVLYEGTAQQGTDDKTSQ